MLWYGAGTINETENYKTSINFENRIFLDSLNQKEFLVNYCIGFTNKKIVPVVGLSLHDHYSTYTEIRPYYGIDSKYFRLLLENRIFDNKFQNRLRARVQYKQEIYSNISLIASEELFWTKKFDNNRFCVVCEYKIKKFNINLGYMSFYKDKNYNTMVVKLIYRI
jgi:hypothetical protein